MKWRWTDKVALGLLGAALLAVVLMNVLPFHELMELGAGAGDTKEWTVTYGWSLWPWILADMMDFNDVSLEDNGPTFGWTLGTLVACVSPFLIQQLAASRLFWWALVILSALVVLALTGVLGHQLLIDGPDTSYFRFREGVFCILMFPVLNFMGLLWIRRRAES